MTHKEYNGWTNYETWLVTVWIDNDSITYSYWEEQAEEYYKADGEYSATSLADALKEYHQEALPKLEGFAADIMNAALSNVDWFEIAESMLSVAKETVGEE